MWRPSYKIYFSPSNNLIQFFNCQNFGHRVVECRYNNKSSNPVIEKTSKEAKVWKEKDNL